MDLDLLVFGLDLVSTFAFALVGARVAASKGLDYGGILFIAAIASISGGTLRNLFVGEQPPWIQYPWLFIPIIAAFLITIAMGRTQDVGRFALSLDTLGLAVATVSSVQYALSNDAPLAAAAVLGFIGAVAGGLFRDIMCQTEPVLLHRETIGTSCLSGAIAYLALNAFELNEPLIAAIAGLVVVVVRELSIKYNWNLPKVVKNP
ncbi:MAG: TRIC cation channel family protein [Actinomycetales bacterium]|nr:TRIC cation channel family protein [Actinomycetales bacterium]